MYRGGNMPCIVNAANEVVVAAFLRDGISFLGKRDVKDPDFAYKANDKKLGITFKHDAADAPVAINGMLKLEEIRVIEGIKQPVNTLAQIRGEYFVASKYDFWKLDSNLKPVVHAQMDPWYLSLIHI